MTKRVVTFIECDICAAPDAKTFDEWKPYTTDLCEVHEKELIAPLREHLQSMRSRSSKSSSSQKTQIGPSGREIRDWARSQGIEVNDRGIIPNSVRDAFAAAH